jgi:hypothetical protein
VFYFFVDVRDHQHVYVGWRAGHLTFMVSAALIGLAFERLAHIPRAMRTAGGIAIALVMLASAPTVAIDAYNTQDISNRDVGAGFRWTLLLTKDEQDAFAWIERHTAPDELIQIDPAPRDPDTWAYLPAFPGRRMFGGLPISMVPLKKYEERSARIREIFDIDPIDAHNRARRSGVRYIFIGPPERAAHPGVDDRFASQPALLPLVYRNPSISIYGVVSAP